jgi:hypothetical protein
MSDPMKLIFKNANQPLRFLLPAKINPLAMDFSEIRISSSIIFFISVRVAIHSETKDIIALY